MTRDEIALHIFCALLQRPGAKVSVADDVARKQIEVAFAIAETFVKVKTEREQTP